MNQATQKSYDATMTEGIRALQDDSEHLARRAGDTVVFTFPQTHYQHQQPENVAQRYTNGPSKMPQNQAFQTTQYRTTQYRQPTTNVLEQENTSVPKVYRSKRTVEQKLERENRFGLVERIKKRTLIYFPVGADDFIANEQITKQANKRGDIRYIIPIKANGTMMSRISPLASAMKTLDDLEQKMPEIWPKYPEYEIHLDKIVATYYSRPN